MYVHARNSVSAAALLAFALCFAPARASAQTPVVFGDHITEPGVYFLAGNQTGIGVGIVIESDDVLFLMGRFTLRGSGIKGGVVSEGYDNVAIWGGRVTNFGWGIALSGGEHCTVKDTHVDHCTMIGMQLVDMSECFFSRVRCDHNGEHGVEALDVDDSRFISILADYNQGNGIVFHLPAVAPLDGFGIDGPDSTHNKLKKCWAAYNGLDGIRLFDADDNEIEENECVNNQLAGIRLGTGLTDTTGSLNAPGSQNNFVRSNWCVFNGTGITVEWSSRSNTLTNNTALANFVRDLVDDNYEQPCVNLWYLNFFLTKGGSGAGCIF